MWGHVPPPIRDQPSHRASPAPLDPLLSPFFFQGLPGPPGRSVSSAPYPLPLGLCLAPRAPTALSAPQVDVGLGGAVEKGEKVMRAPLGCWPCRAPCYVFPPQKAVPVRWHPSALSPPCSKQPLPWGAEGSMDVAHGIRGARGLMLLPGAGLRSSKHPPRSRLGGPAGGPWAPAVLLLEASSGSGCSGSALRDHRGPGRLLPQQSRSLRSSAATICPPRGCAALGSRLSARASVLTPLLLSRPKPLRTGSVAAPHCRGQGSASDRALPWQGDAGDPGEDGAKGARGDAGSPGLPGERVGAGPVGREVPGHSGGGPGVQGSVGSTQDPPLHPRAPTAECVSCRAWRVPAAPPALG